MKKVLLGTNFKMHKTINETIEYVSELNKLTNKLDKMQFFIVPSFVSLSEVKKTIKDTNILLGAQNMHWDDEGAYTGEISPVMLKEVGVDIIELGHSERRQYYNETDFTVNKKVLSSLKFDFTTLICVGEPLIYKEYGTSYEYLSLQIKIALKAVEEKDMKKVWIAYEPLWAIGEKGIQAEPSYIGEIHDSMRKVLIELYGEKIGHEVPILFGGSVNYNNSAEYLKLSNVDGLFIGRAAWDAKKFSLIAKMLNDTVINN